MLKVVRDFIVDLAGIFYGCFVALRGVILRDPEFLKVTD